MLDASAWRFWDGSTWQRDAGDSAQLVAAVDGVSQTLSVFHRGDRWYALSKRDGDLGDQMAFWTAPRANRTLHAHRTGRALPADPTTGAITYMPLAHPQIFPQPGTMVTSYSNNNTDPQKIKDDPTLYRPTFLRVPLPEVTARLTLDVMCGGCGPASAAATKRPPEERRIAGASVTTRMPASRTATDSPTPNCLIVGSPLRMKLAKTDAMISARRS